MGYYIQQIDCIDFLIKKENFEDALRAIRKLKGKETIKDSGGRHFAWVDEEYAEATSLKQALHAWRWEPSHNEAGDIERLDFDGQKLGDDEILMRAIAPYVEKGIIEMQGEEGERWRWVFSNGKLRELSSEITWKEHD